MPPKYASSSHNMVAYYGGTFTYAQLQAQINAGQPMLLNLKTYAPGYGWVGHTVLAYGYQDNMFNLRISTGRFSYSNVSVPGFAVMDTWMNGVGPGTQADWYGWSGQIVYAKLDSQNREWWPFLNMTQTRGYSYTNRWDWQVVDGVFYQPNGGTSSAGPAGASRLTARSNDLAASQNMINIKFSDNDGSGSSFSSGLMKSLSNHSRISSWSGGGDSGFEAVTHVMTFH